MRMQDKVLGAIETAIEKADGLEVVSKPQWANTGSLFIQHKGGFTTLVQVGYDFQDNYFTLQIGGEVLTSSMRLGAMEFTPSGSYPTNPCPTWARDVPAFGGTMQYVDGSKIESFMSDLTTVLGTLASK